jgi:FkbM family methyltransferase
MKTIIEVGANSGTDTKKWIKDSSNRVFAIEPTPQLCSILWNKFSTYENFHLIQAAIDLDNGWRKFNVAGHGDWGCSSLYDFNTDLETTWPGRTDFKVTEKINVLCFRLDTILKISNINEIDYLWIDAQGNDFRVLQSLGDNIHNVKEGKCEVAYSVELYKDTSNRIDVVKPWLESKGFSVEVNLDRVNRYDKQHKECDLIFKK